MKSSEKTGQEKLPYVVGAKISKMFRLDYYYEFVFKRNTE